MAVYTLTLSSTTGFTGTIGLTCSGGPPNSTCTGVPSSVTLTSGSETAKVTVDLAVPRGASKGTFTLTFTNVRNSDAQHDCETDSRKVNGGRHKACPQSHCGRRL